MEIQEGWEESLGSVLQVDIHNGGSQTRMCLAGGYLSRRVEARPGGVSSKWISRRAGARSLGREG